MKCSWIVCLVAVIGCSGVAPTLTAPSQVVSLARVTLTSPTTVHYGSHPRQIITVWFPPTGCLHKRFVLWIHGGQWTNGDNSLPVGDPVLRLLNRCFAVASVDFRQTTDSTWPAQIRDVKAATRWLRAHGANVGVLTDSIGVWGFSSGAHLAFVLGTSCGDSFTGNGTPDECVQAVVGWSGPYRFESEDAELTNNGCPVRVGLPGSAEEQLLGAPVAISPLLASSNPLTYTGRPAMRVAAGALDCTIPRQQAVAVDSAWTGLHAVNVYTAGHNRVGVWAADSVVRPVLDFFEARIR